MRPFVIYHPSTKSNLQETLGQSWRNQEIEDLISLCPEQTSEPAILKYLSHGKILEAGCGTGRWLFYLTRRGINIIGVDLAQEALDDAKSFDPNAPVEKMDIKKTTFSSGSFDGILSLGVVEHFEEGPTEVLREIFRLLKDDGIFVVSVPTQNLNRYFLANPLKKIYWMVQRFRGISYVFEEYRYSRREFSSIIRREGFSILEMIPDDFKPPKNMGLWVDYPFLRKRGAAWELNFWGEILRRFFWFFSPWFASSGTLWVCKKTSIQDS